MLNLIHKAIPGFIASMAAEYVAAKQTGRDEVWADKRDAMTSISMGLINVAGEAVMKRATRRINQWCYDHRICDFPLQGAARKAAIIVIDDFAYYWFHRMSHEVRVLWSAHVNHHSSEQYNLSTALRQSWFTPITKVPFFAPMCLIGLTPDEVEHAHHVNLVYQYWVHTQLVDRIGPLEEVLSTPSHHRVHHGTNLDYLDTNYGGIFIVWDRLFGTFQREKADDPVEYGILHNLNSYNLAKAEFHEFAAMVKDATSAGSVADALRHVWGPPGWSPDGSSMTVTEMRAAAAAADGGATSPAP